MSVRRTRLADLPSLVGATFGPLDDDGFTQTEVDAFGTLTQDRQWIHVDVDRAAAAGGTIVHGFLLAARIGSLWGEILEVVDSPVAVNYGLDRVRFPAALPVGVPYSLRAAIADVDVRASGVLVRLDVAVTAVGASRPSLVASSLVLFRS